MLANNFMLILLFIAASSSHKISHLTALLQFKDPHSAKAHTPHFTISAEGGCFKWTSLNPNIVRVIPQNESCSTSALVEAVATGPTRRSTAIIAESNHGTTLKCDVFVDSVKSLSILTTTRSIYLESSLETLSLLAMDSENNTFTSLEGTEIKWKIDREHLRVISTEEAKLFLPEIMPNKSASLIVQGTKIGKTWAEATLDGIHHASVSLNVVKALSFLPFPIIRTLPYHHIPFKLCSARDANRNSKINGAPIGVTVDKNHISHVEFDPSYCISQIQLPSNLYSITTSNPRSMTADQSAYATTHEPGQSTITVSDISIVDNTASTLVYVTYPTYVDQPPQYIALGDDPVFNPILKDQNGIPLDIFEPIAWEIQGEWKTIGEKRIKLRYHDYSFIAIVYVCPPLVMDPPEAVLPERYSDFIVEPKGGSGFYDFYIEDPGIISYENSTYKVTTYREGRTKIRVQDKKIRKYHNFSDILVSKIAYIDIQMERRELINDINDINNVFRPKCEIYAIESKRFSVKINYTTHSTDHNVVSSQMKPQNPGFSKIYCEAGLEHTQSEQILVSTANSLSAFVEGRGSPMSTINLTVTGGVLTWPESQPPKVEVTCPNTKVTNLPEYHFTVDREYSGLCTATMQNFVSDLNPIPLVLSTDFWLNVSYVNYFDLYVTDKLASEDPRCNAPLRRLDYYDVFNYTFKNQIKAYRVITGRSHRLIIFPRDIDGNIIKYYSAVPFELRTSFNEHLPINNFGPEGQSVYFYTPMNSTDLTVISPGLSTSVTSLIEIKPIILPPTQMFYYKPGNIYSFPIEGGSGYFRTKNDNANFVQGNLQYSPHYPGEQTVSINDTCAPYSTKYLYLNAVSVETLQIIAPQYVFVNQEFKAQVKAYGQRSILIPDNLLPEAGITMQPNWAKRAGIDTWSLRPTSVGKLPLRATSENDKQAYTTVDVIESLIITPRYIEFLPGDKEYLTIKSGPPDIVFEYEDERDQSIASHNKENNRYVIRGHTPGNITINAYIRNRELMEDMQPYKIYVRVLRPISLKIEPTSKTPIQTGYIGLRLLVLTDAGYRVPRKAEWKWHDQQPNNLQGYSHLQINDSFAFVNLSSQYVPLRNSHVSDVIVEVEAFHDLNKNLTAKYSTHIEPKLILTTPNLVILPPHCTFQIGILNYGDTKMIQGCTFRPDNESIISCEGGLIRSYSTEGETTVNIIYGHQQLAIRVRVSKPSFLHIRQISFSDMQIMLLDPYGLLYSSYNGVKYSLSGPTGFTSSKIDPYGFCRVQFPFEDEIELHAIAMNPDFLLETSIRASIKQKIIPSNVFLMKNASHNFQCTAVNPYWSSSRPSVLKVFPDGSAIGLSAGEAYIKCGPNIQSKVVVVEMTDIQLINQPNDEFKISTRYSSPLVSNNNEDIIFKEPLDLQFNCTVDDTSCASAYYKKNETGRFCVLKRVLKPQKGSSDNDVAEGYQYQKCSPDAKLIVVASSISSNLKLTADAPISSGGNIDFGIPREYKCEANLTSLKCTISLLLNESEVIIKKPHLYSDKLFIEWLNSREFVIRIDPTFTSKANIYIEHKVTGEVATIKIIRTDSIHRSFELGREIKVLIALIGLFGGISYIILKLTFVD